MTPMLKQYFALKSKVPENILFFRMGDFYEVFGEDSKKIAPVLDIVLTNRDKGDKTKIQFCGVPHHSAKSYWLKLLRLGYKISIADQMESADESKGLIKRDIVKTFTPGCIDELDGLDKKTPNYIGVLIEEPKTRCFALIIADISTGYIRLGNIEKKDIIKEIFRFNIKEILIRRFMRSYIEKIIHDHQDLNIIISYASEEIIRDIDEQNRLVSEIFGDNIFLNIKNINGSKMALSVLFKYLKDLNLPIKQFLNIKGLTDPKNMILDKNVISDLEIFTTGKYGNKKNSLFEIINNTLTPMGSRKLYYYLNNPILDLKKIKKIHKYIDFFLNIDFYNLDKIRFYLSEIYDIERIFTRILSLRLTPNELYKLKISLNKTYDIIEFINKIDDNIIFNLLKDSNYESFSLILNELNNSIEDDPGFINEGNGVFKSGYDKDFDKYINLFKNANTAIKDFENKLIFETKINNLKIKNHKNFGLLIEITKSNLKKVPNYFIKKQTMVNCERFTTMELEELNLKLLQSNKDVILKEKELYTKFLLKLAKYQKDIIKLSKFISFIDLVQSHSWLAINNKYVKPIFSNDKKLILKKSRHPVIEKIKAVDEFICNDIFIDKNQPSILITGPNMSGKSTVMRQIALSVIMHQIGSFVPASKAIMPIFDNLFTRIGAFDNISAGHSTFMIEMLETANILRNATKDSLLIIDEIGRGTSSEDGLALAASILEYITDTKKSFLLFSTHYHKLSNLYQNNKMIKQMQVEVKYIDGKIKFTHKFIKGASSSSYGLEVAKLAGISQDIINNAKKKLNLK